MKKLKLLNALFLTTDTEAETEQRALEVLQLVKPILECQKPFWRRQIEKLFEEFINGNEDPIDIMNRKKDGLYWDFHKYVFYGMCEVYQAD